MSMLSFKTRFPVNKENIFVFSLEEETSRKVLLKNKYKVYQTKLFCK